ncbi:MAG: hypothetical protein OXG17_07255, partial [Chloroflexi bacterium]|nr:hypothetical protein [Chloroflexota bacterium]
VGGGVAEGGEVEGLVVGHGALRVGGGLTAGEGMVGCGGGGVNFGDEFGGWRDMVRGVVGRGRVLGVDGR